MYLRKRKERGGSEEERFDEKRVRILDEKSERFEDGEERGKRDVRKERSRFGDVDVDGQSKRGGFDEVSVKNEDVNGVRTGFGGSAANGASSNMASGTLPEASFATGDNPKMGQLQLLGKVEASILLML